MTTYSSVAVERLERRIEQLEAALREARELIASRHFVKGRYLCRYCWEADGHLDDCPARAALDGGTATPEPAKRYDCGGNCTLRCEHESCVRRPS